MESFDDRQNEDLESLETLVKNNLQKLQDSLSKRLSNILERFDLYDNASNAINEAEQAGVNVVEYKKQLTDLNERVKKRMDDHLERLVESGRVGLCGN